MEQQQNFILDPENINQQEFLAHLQKQGWCFVKIPHQVSQQMKELEKNVKNYFKNTSESEKQKFSQQNKYGYVQTQQKQVLRYLTKDFLMKQDQIDLIPKKDNLQLNITNLSIHLDNLCQKIIKSSQDTLFQQKLPQNEIPLINQSNQQASFGMLDIVQYYENKNDQTRQSTVSEHVDPGLFSISLYQSEKGLHLKNAQNQYISAPVQSYDIGVLWTGMKAIECSQNTTNLAPGWHEVQLLNKDRFTVWYEVCTYSQVHEEITKSFDLSILNKQKEEQEKGQLEYGEFEIFVKTLTGKKLSFMVDFSTSVDDLLAMIQDSQGIPPQKNRLVAGGVQLHTGKNLNDYNIKKGSIIHMVLSLR